MQAPTVTLGGRSLTLDRPASSWLAVEVVSLGAHNRSRAGAAALAVCWPAADPARPTLRYGAGGAGYDLGAYGGAVADDLISRGVDPVDLLRAAERAYLWVVSCLPTAKAVKEAENFSSAREEGG
jgi:hypothetical protein